MKLQAEQLDDGTYTIPNAGTINREMEPLTPNGEPLNGSSAYKNTNGELVDFDKYINVLAERQNINL